MQRKRILSSAVTSAALAATALLIVPGAAQAQSGSPMTYLVSLNTSSLLPNGTYTGPFTLDFAFVDGDNQITSTYDNNNTVAISGFSGGTGFSASSFTLTDGTPGLTSAAGKTVTFIPGQSLSFLTTLTTNEDQSIADNFTFAIRHNGQPFTTEDASWIGDNNGDFVSIMEASPGDDPQNVSVSTFDTRAQEFQPVVTPAPEPSGAVTLLVGFLVSGLVVSRRLRPGRLVPAQVPAPRE